MRRQTKTPKMHRTVKRLTKFSIKRAPNALKMKKHYLLYIKIKWKISYLRKWPPIPNSRSSCNSVWNLKAAAAKIIVSQNWRRLLNTETTSHENNAAKYSVLFTMIQMHAEKASTVLSGLWHDCTNEITSEDRL